jgi:hypothetical protein
MVLCMTMLENTHFYQQQNVDKATFIFLDWKRIKNRYSQLQLNLICSSCVCECKLIFCCCSQILKVLHIFKRCMSYFFFFLLYNFSHHSLGETCTYFSVLKSKQFLLESWLSYRDFFTIITHTGPKHSQMFCFCHCRLNMWKTKAWLE